MYEGSLISLHITMYTYHKSVIGVTKQQFRMLRVWFFKTCLKLKSLLISTFFRSTDELEIWNATKWSKQELAIGRSAWPETENPKTGDVAPQQTVTNYTTTSRCCNNCSTTRTEWQVRVCCLYKWFFHVETPRSVR